MTAKIRAVKLLFVAALILLLCSLYMFFYKPTAPGGQTEPQEEAVYAITDIPVNEVAAVMVVNENMKFGILVNGAQLEAVSSVEGNYSQSELRGLIYGASHLTGSRKITDGSNNSQYGLDRPSSEITIIKTDKTEVKLKLLSKSPLEDTYYLYSEADDAVYLIADTVAELFLRGEEDFFSHTVLPVIGSENFQQLDWIEMDSPKTGKSYRMTQSEGNFFLEQPIIQKLSAINVLKNLLMPVSALYSDEFVEASADLKEYGFEDYTMRIRMNVDKTQYGVLLLDKGDGTCLMADERSGDVYRLGSESLYKLPGDYLPLLEGKAFSYAAGDLTSIELEAGEEYMLLDLAQISASEESPERQLVNSVCSAEYIAETTNQTKLAEILGKETPKMTVIFTLKSGSRDTIRLYETPEGGYYAETGGTVNFIIGQNYVEKIEAAMADLK